MMSRKSASESGIGSFLMVSAVMHVAVFLLALWWTRLFPFQMSLQETYYVDVVNLPVASPRAGSPTQQGESAEAPPPPPLPAPSGAMALPAPPKPASRVPAPAARDKVTGAAESDEFAERMAKLASKAESREQDAAIERLRRKVTAGGSGRSGMPSATGSEAGSDYAAYLQSRLKDAFRDTISYTSKQPEVLVRLVVSADGRISRKKIEKSSGDRAFELAVLRAVDLASEKFPPPPGRKPFEAVFVFRPQGISNSGTL